ncbi:MAG: hypothetical protein EXQ47_06285 [Bryobacterales bacterium]|nr:hypothetical protein [Bryobacterales bacterium]
MRRRDFLVQGAAGVLAARNLQAAWESGPVAHLLATASHQRILLKASFQTALAKAPVLRVGKRSFLGTKTDSAGRFWQFDAAGLEAGRPHQLQLIDAARKPLCAPWSLQTLPDPSEQVSRFRVLIYTCAGGHDALLTPDGSLRFLSLARRRRLLARALSFRPDAVIANGDHVYWDLRRKIASRMAATPAAIAYAGEFDRRLPVLGSPNEPVLLRAAGPQIADLYGTAFREVPVFFLTDDHDYFENDEADDQLITFPPEDFNLQLGRTARRMYYPEFLPDVTRPAGLPGSSALDRPPGSAEAYGTLRWGQLAEVLLYDCRRFMTLGGPGGVFVAPEAEQWLKDRMAAPGVAHVVNVPSTPPGWSAGKWGEWYPDMLDDRGKLGVAKPKPYWQPGWAAQHDRILKASSEMHGRVPLFISGDLHAIGEGRILRTGNADLRSNPVVSILSGPVGTARDGWPSTLRGTPALPAQRLEMDERQKAIEENGFTIMDFTPEKITARYFKWNVNLPEEAMDQLEPFRVSEFQRPG